MALSGMLRVSSSSSRVTLWLIVTGPWSFCRVWSSLHCSGHWTWAEGMGMKPRAARPPSGKETYSLSSHPWQVPAQQRPLLEAPPAPGLPEAAPAPGHARGCPLDEKEVAEGTLREASSTLQECPGNEMIGVMSTICLQSADHRHRRM